jgi:hypothetical protein
MNPELNTSLLVNVDTACNRLEWFDGTFLKNKLERFLNHTAININVMEMLSDILMPGKSHVYRVTHTKDNQSKDHGWCRQIKVKTVNLLRCEKLSKKLKTEWWWKDHPFDSIEWSSDDLIGTKASVFIKRTTFEGDIDVLLRIWYNNKLITAYHSRTGSLM